LKTLAARCGIETIDRRGGGVNIKFHPGAAIDPRRLMQLVSETAGAQFTPAGVLRVPLAPLPPGELLEALRARIAELAS
jgi:transcription-repair coupling factor (superfamily II helicase)